VRKAPLILAASVLLAIAVAVLLWMALRPRSIAEGPLGESLQTVVECRVRFIDEKEYVLSPEATAELIENVRKAKVDTNPSKWAVMGGIACKCRSGEKIWISFSPDKDLLVSKPNPKGDNISFYGQSKVSICKVLRHQAADGKPKDLGEAPASGSPDPINSLVTRLNADPLWCNGIFPTITLPADAQPEAVLAEAAKRVGFDHGYMKTFHILQVRSVELTASGEGKMKAALIDSDLGTKILLFGHGGEAAGWWTRFYDVPDTDANPKK
jgi:hypothetical protein